MAFAKQYIAWKKRGWKRKDFLLFLSESGYSITPRSLNNWTAALNTHESVIIETCGAGRPSSLSEEEIQILAGFIFDQNEKNIEVHLSTAQNFIFNSFGIHVAQSTVHGYLKALGISSKVCGTRTSGFQLDQSNLCILAHEWIRTAQIHCKPSQLCSVDFTFTSHRSDRRVTYGLRGTSQPKSDQVISRFTNCIITCIWADGINRTPSVLFTYNQEFRFDRNETPRRLGQLDKLNRTLETSNIDPRRIIFVGKQKGEGRCYVPESSSLVRQFFALYKVSSNWTVLSDNGNSFKEDGKDIFQQLGFENHEYYPAAVHQYLSPNDNKLHGAAKQKWRQLGIDFSDDVIASISLLKCLDDCSDKSYEWFDRNLQIRAPTPKVLEVEKLIGEIPIGKAKFSRHCLQKYTSFQRKSSSPKKIEQPLEDEKKLNST